MKILLISPRFFGYFRDISDGLEICGNEVDILPDMPSDSNFAKAVGRVASFLLWPIANQWFKNVVLPKAKSDFDVVVVVGGMTLSLTPAMIRRLKRVFSKAQFIMYQWDSERNVPKFKKYHSLFDKVVTSDPTDVRGKVAFQQLFIPSEFTNTVFEEKEVKYDCCYIGTAHPKKLVTIDRLSEQLRSIMPRQYIYHYLPSKLKYFYHKILNKEYRPYKYAYFQNKKLSRDEVAEVVKASRVVLDSPQGGQRGLTFRVFEALGAGRKLITSNADIKNYDFYDPQNIYVYDGEKIDYADPFFTQPYKPVNRELLEKYSLKSWVENLLR